MVLATATLFATLPRALAGPLIGSYVDRWDRRTIMIIADGFVALFTLGLGALFFLDVVQVWHIYALMLLRALAGLFHGMAMSTSTSLVIQASSSSIR